MVAISTSWVRMRFQSQRGEMLLSKRFTEFQSSLNLVPGITHPLGLLELFFFFFNFYFYSYFIYLFIYFWLCWVFGSCEGFL